MYNNNIKNGSVVGAIVGGLALGVYFVYTEVFMWASGASYGQATKELEHTEEKLEKMNKKLEELGIERKD